tara:strand:+ start:592 stop:861 length:270 start_codon:yes stop_codon:yes gene_type:complete
MGNIIDELFKSDKEKEVYEQETLKQQDQAIMQLANDKRHFQNAVGSLDDILNNERLITSMGDKDFKITIKLRDNFNEIIKNIEKEIELI